MDLHNQNGSSFYVIHIPGKGKVTQSDILKEESKKLINIDERIKVITIATPDIIENAPLIKQLDQKYNLGLGLTCPPDYYPCINAYYYISGKEWNMSRKLEAFATALDVNNIYPYTLLVDANDVAICRDLDAAFIDKFKTFACEALYNSTSNRHPDRKVERKSLKGRASFTPYLNAGVCFGRTEYLRDIYYDAAVLAKYSNEQSEQYFIRKIFDHEYPKIKVDTNQDLFGCWHYNDAKVHDDGLVTYGRSLWKIKIDLNVRVGG